MIIQKKEEYERGGKKAIEIKKKIIERHFKSKDKIKKKIRENKVNHNVKELIEDMWILSTITKEEIIKEKKNNPEKFIEFEEAIKTPDKKSSMFIMGLLGKY